MAYSENITSTRGYWDNRSAKMAADAQAASGYANSPEGRLEAAERKLRAMRYDRGAYTDEQIKDQQAKVREMENEIKAAQEAKFAAEWTLETTTARRAEWNAWVKSLKGKVSNGVVAQRERQQGWTFASLKKAISLHQL